MFFLLALSKGDLVEVSTIFHIFHHYWDGYHISIGIMIPIYFFLLKVVLVDKSDTHFTTHYFEFFLSFVFKGFVGLIRCIYICTCIYIYIDASKYVCMCIYNSLYIYIYIYINKHSSSVLRSMWEEFVPICKTNSRPHGPVKRTHFFFYISYTVGRISHDV